MSEIKRYRVIDGPLSIRDAANGNRLAKKLAQGTEITVKGEPVKAGDYIWIQHESGWSAIAPIDQSTSYLLDISDVDPNAPRRFKVVTDLLSVRATANGKKLDVQLKEDDEIDVDAQSRTVTGGYIWWQHAQGWSAESDERGKDIYLEEIVAIGEAKTPQTQSDAPAPAQAEKETKPEKIAPKVPEGEQKRYQIISGPLSIRTQADGDRISKQLSQGQEITVYGEPIEKGEYVWVQHDAGWSALSPADETEYYMLDITDRDPNAPRRFRVWSYVLSVRQTANGKRTSIKIRRGTEIEAKPQSRTEAGGYIWWEHDKGWSAERNVAGNQVFLKEIFATPDSIPIPEDKKVKIPESWKGSMTLQVAKGIKVRGKPSTDPRGLVIRTIPRGEVVQCDMSTLTEADNYYWVKHDLGWSAIQSVNGKTVFLAEPGTIKGLIAIGPNGPKAEDLPGYREMFTRLPVNLEDIQWWQYFGNNMFAMRNGRAYGYDRYSQGLHGGLDFGNSKAPKTIFAGLEAEYVKTDYARKNNTKIYLKKGDYTIIYQHITNAQHFSEGQIITPDTKIGLIEHHSINNGWDHLHLEIRFMKKWIINPLLLFTEEIYNQLIARFDPTKPNTSYKRDFPKSTNNFFYDTATWDKWATPLDQPMLKLAGPVIGPRGELDKSEL